MNLNNVLHTHIDGIRCIEKFLETSQLKISFQKHHFSHIFALSQTSESGCQGVWKSKNRYVCTFCRLGCVLMMVWSWNFFLRKGMIPNKYRKAEFGVRNLTKFFFAPFKVKQLGTQNTIFGTPQRLPFRIRLPKIVFWVPNCLTLNGAKKFLVRICTPN